jgi:hypothetical protein
MSDKTIFPLILIALIISSLACSLSSLTGGQADDPQATINAAIAATATAQAELEAMVDEAVEEAVDEAIAEIEEEYLLMTEEEFDQAIEQAVNDATTATEQTNTSIEEAASDGTMTSEEIEEIEEYVYYADEMIYYAEDLIYTYYDLYAELAYETLYLLEAVEEDLEDMANAMVEVAELTLDAAEAIANGMEVNQDTISQYITVTQSTQETISNIPDNWQTWADAVQGERLARLESIEGISANNVPADLQSALSETLNFADAVRNALGDYSISINELLDIAQIGANAIAGLQAHGGPAGGAQNMAGVIDNITNNLALGQNQNAINNLSTLEGSLRDMPDFNMPERPGFTPPDIPSVPRPGGGRPGRP